MYQQNEKPTEGNYSMWWQIPSLIKKNNFSTSANVPLVFNEVAGWTVKRTGQYSLLQLSQMLQNW